MYYRFLLSISFSMMLLVSCKSDPKADTSEKGSVDPLLKQFKIGIYDSVALALIDSAATFEILAEGFYWSKGPLWVDELTYFLMSLQIK